MNAENPTVHAKALSLDVRAGQLQDSIQMLMEQYADLRERVGPADPIIANVLDHRIECLVEARKWFRYALSYQPRDYLPEAPPFLQDRPRQEVKE